MFTPQHGREKVALYLTAAERMFTGTDFRYTEIWCRDTSAVLHFEAEMNGAQLEGVDTIAWNETEQITSFKVMIRPLRGLQPVISIMGELIAETARPPA